jgi:ATP-dependent Zn protease
MHRWSTVMDMPFQIFACNIRSGSSNAVVKKKMKPAKAAIQSFFQQQKEKGHDLKSCLSQADTGHLPEIEDIFQVEKNH